MMEKQPGTTEDHYKAWLNTLGECIHEWVAPVTRESDGYLHLTYPSEGLKSYEIIREQRGNLIERMIYCRHCGAKPEEA